MVVTLDSSGLIAFTMFAWYKKKGYVLGLDAHYDCRYSTFADCTNAEDF